MIKRGLKNWKDISDLQGMLFLYSGCSRMCKQSEADAKCHLAACVS